MLTSLVKTSIYFLCFHLFLSFIFEIYDVKLQCNNQVLQQKNRWSRIVDAIWLRNIDLASTGKFITLLLNRSGITKKQFTLKQFGFFFFFFREMINSSNQQNGTKHEKSSLWFSSSECIAWLTVFMTESVAILTLNILTIIVFIKNRSLRKRSMYLVINLAVADMFVGGCTDITYFVSFGELCSFWNIRRLPPIVALYIMRLFVPASLTSLTAISLERAHATFRPFRHRIIKKWVFGFIITIIWVTSGMLEIAMYLLLNPESVGKIRSLFNGFCLFVICVSYVSIVVKISCGAHPQHHGATSRERKLTKTLLIVTVISLLLWLPFTIFTVLSVYLPFFISYRVGLHLIHAFIVLFYANSLVNPILYAVRMPDFKRALVSLFRRQQRQVEIIPLGPL